MSELFAHHPGTTPLHRLPAGAKLLGLLVAAVVVMVVRGPIAALVGTAVAVLFVLWSGIGLRRLLRSLRALAVVLVALAVFHTWQHGWQRAVETVGDLVTLVLLATVVTATTPVTGMLDAVTAGLRPLRRIGVQPGRVALAFALTLRTIPYALHLAAESRNAARARGLERDPRARLVPVVLRMVAHARATGDALWARDVAELEPSDEADDQCDRGDRVGR